jgi:hypothetical protein
MTPFGEEPLSAIYAGTLSREQNDRIVWNQPEALDAIFHAGNLLIEAKGRTKELVSIDLESHRILPRWSGRSRTPSRKPDLARFNRRADELATRGAL